MSSFFKTGNLVKLLLLAAGTVVLLIGFIEFFIDFVTDWKISEYINIFVMLSGVTILLATIFVYMIIPEYRNHQRLERLHQYYAGEPGGEAREIIHNIMEKSQEIVMGTDLLAESVRTCVAEGVTHEECGKRIPEARELLEHVNDETIKLQDYLNQLESHIRYSGKDSSTKMRDIK